MLKQAEFEKVYENDDWKVQLKMEIYPHQTKGKKGFDFSKIEKVIFLVSAISSKSNIKYSSDNRVYQGDNIAEAWNALRKYVGYQLLPSYVVEMEDWKKKAGKQT